MQIRLSLSAHSSCLSRRSSVAFNIVNGKLIDGINRYRDKRADSTLPF